MSTLLSDDDLARLLQPTGERHDVPVAGPDRVVAAVHSVPSRGPAFKRHAWQVAAAVAVVVLLVALAHLGGGSSVSSSGGSGKASSGPASAQGSAGSAATSSIGKPAQPQLGAPQPATGSVRTAPRAIPADGARIVKTGTIVLRAGDGKVSTVLAAVQSVVAQARGYVAASTSEEAGTSPTGTVTMRVPEAAYEGVVARVRLLGAKVVSDSSRGTDVTAAYADTQAQIGSLTTSRNRFLVILGQAKTIGEILSVQQRVDDVQGQIDRLEGQRRVLADQSDLATLTVSVSESGVDVVLEGRSGIARAWHDAVHGFTSGVEGIIARSGRALVVLLSLALLFVVGRLAWRFARRAVL